MARYRVWGNSHAVTLAPELRQKLGLVHGDWLLVLLDGDVMTIRKVSKREVFAGHSIDIRRVQSTPVNEPRGSG